MVNETAAIVKEVPKKANCLEEIERLKQQREERRKKITDFRRQKTEREQANQAQGINCDVDFQQMVEYTKQ